MKKPPQPPAKKSKDKDTFPRTIVFGGGRVYVARRQDGNFALRWREGGLVRLTTKTDEARAVAFAEQKARNLDSATGQRWITPAQAEILERLGRIAGPDGPARLLDDVDAALVKLEHSASLTAAATFYAERGPLKVQRMTVAAAIERFLKDYASGSPATFRTFTNELLPFAKKHPAMPMLDLTLEVLAAWTGRKVNGHHEPAPKTRLSRITTWQNFCNRCREWNLLGPGKTPAELLRRPVIPDAGREILTIAQGKALLAAVLEKDRRMLPYLLICGWLGLRPSECQRLTWKQFHWEGGYLHVCAQTAQKTSTERFVPMDQRLAAALRWIYETSDKEPHERVCGFRSREFLSVLARAEGVVARWVPDVLRHSFCSYRLAATADLARVAEEAGNSPQIIRSNYRRPVPAAEGLAWWNLLDVLVPELEIQPPPTPVD